MAETRRYEFEGVVLEIPLRYGPLSRTYIEEYPDFVREPVCTPAACPVLFSGEDTSLAFRLEMTGSLHVGQ